MDPRKEVIITKDNYLYTDEIYTSLFGCPNCEDGLLQLGFIYCPNCGSKIVWDITEDKYR